MRLISGSLRQNFSKRWNHDSTLLEKNKNVEFIAELMEKRREKYEAAADIIIETDGKNKKEICEELVKKVIAWSEGR